MKVRKITNYIITIVIFLLTFVMLAVLCMLYFYLTAEDWQSFKIWFGSCVRHDFLFYLIMDIIGSLMITPNILDILVLIKKE